MGCEQVCLKWNNFSCNITKNIDDLWKDESLVDVSLISDGQCIQAHKVILSASSPLFKSLFAVNPCQHPVIILQDVRFRELVSIITFIYKGEVNILEDNLPALLKAAKTLQIRGLSDSVDRDSLNRLYALRKEESERAPKKRKTRKTSDDEEEKIIPKAEPKQEVFSADFLVTVSDDEDVSPEDIVLHQRKQDDMLQTTLAHAEEESKHHEPFPAEFLAHVSDEDDVKTELSEEHGGQLCMQAEPPSDDCTVYSFACPFCKRKYTNWGFRRRHIKGVHRDKLPCKSCKGSSYTLQEWIYHMLDEHNCTSAEVEKFVAVYHEAIDVLKEDITHSASTSGKPHDLVQILPADPNCK